MTQALDTIDHYVVCQEEALKAVFAGKAEGVLALYEYNQELKAWQSYKAGESTFGLEVNYCTNGTKGGYIWSIYDEATNTGKLLASIQDTHITGISALQITLTVGRWRL